MSRAWSDADFEKWMEYQEIKAEMKRDDEFLAQCHPEAMLRRATKPQKPKPKGPPNDDKKLPQ